jgi:N-dimethylarginine dimethylaminohydrolase
MDINEFIEKRQIEIDIIKKILENIEIENSNYTNSVFVENPNVVNTKRLRKLKNILIKVIRLLTIKKKNR